MRTPDESDGGCIVFVLGMHRSGTSVFTNCLVKAGMHIVGELLQPDSRINPDGFFEDARVVTLNDRLLAHLGRTWMDYRPLELGQRNAFISQWRRDAAEHVRLQYPANSVAVVKDPRMCRTWPYWFEVLEEAGRDVRVAHIVRSPMDVAASLRRRDAVSLDYGLLMWAAHVLAAVEGAARASVSVTLTYDSMLRSPQETIARVCARLGVSPPDDISFDNIQREMAPPVGGREPGMVSDDLHAFVTEVYSVLEDWAESGADHAGGRVKPLWSRWQDLLARYKHRWEALRETAEDLQKLSQRLVEVGSLYGSAQQIVAERDRQLEELNAKLDAIGSEHSHAQKVVAERDSQLAVINEKLAALGREYAHAQKVVAERDSQLAQLNAQLEQLGSSHANALEVVAHRDCQLEEQAAELQSLRARLARLQCNWFGRLLVGRKR